MVLHNPNNWHWVNKDVSAWTQEYLEKDLTTVSAEDGGVTAKITKVVSMEGEADVSQRKGKVITIFDVKLQLEYSGNNKDGEEATGTITIPEVAYNTEEDEYVFDIDMYSESNTKQPVKDLVRSKITPQLRKRLQLLGAAMMEEHGKDIQHAPGTNPSSGFATPKYSESSSINKSDSSAAKAEKPTGSAATNSRISVTTVNDETEFQTEAEQLFLTFTDRQRIAAFTRSDPKVFDGAQPGGKFELFGGNVSGEYVSLHSPHQIVQKWRLAQWPEGHFSTLEINFAQDNTNFVTKMKVNWSGVPVGQEDVTKTNWDNYYVRSIKTTFGFGAIL